MKREDDQELWDLLGKAGEPAISPFFARNVLRSIQQERSWRDRLSNWLAPRRLIPASAVAITIIAAAFAFERPGSTRPTADNMPDVVAQLDEIDYEVVADLEDLLASEEDNLWSDGDTLTL